jgi:CheY-like chemotaxis protein
VSDSGRGIESQLLSYVFDRFRQGDSRIDRQSSGLGLGLAIARSLVELHGGTVSAQSDGPGKGACFTIKLQILIARAVHDEERVHPAITETIATNGGPSLKHLKVLVVDDEAGAREIAAAILIQAQAEVRTAESASAALAIMNKGLPDVLVADIEMPEVDRYAFSQVRTRPPQRGRNVPAAALTAYARTRDRMRVLSSGYQMHIPKRSNPLSW